MPTGAMDLFLIGTHIWAAREIRAHTGWQQYLRELLQESQPGR
jgi:hypothetical protein